MDLNDLKFDEKGLIPCITQDFADDRILMLAYMSRESLAKTIAEGKAFYFSRSRNRLWLKGEESGNFQVVKEVYVDCDKDTLLLKVEQIGGCACHKGFRSCFFRRLEQNTWNVFEDPVKDPGDMYNNKQ